MKAMRDVWGDTLVELGKSNPNVLVLDADLANSTKADKFARAYPERFLQMGHCRTKLCRCCRGPCLGGLYTVALDVRSLFYSSRGGSDPHARSPNAGQRETWCGVCGCADWTYGKNPSRR